MRSFQSGLRLCAVACALTLAAACTRSNDKAGGDGPGSGGAPGVVKCSGSGIADTGCACLQPGARQPCWPGDPALRGRGDCKDGVQTCVAAPAGAGESFGTPTWSACAGYVVGQRCVGPCTPSEFQGCTQDSGSKDHLGSGDSGGVGGGPGGKDHLGGADAGGVGVGPGSGGGGDGGACAAQCVPGALRWCDEPVYCNWGQQTCGPNGRWGTCAEVTTRPGNCRGSSYDPQCCVNAGACCQDLFGLSGQPGGGLPAGGFPSCFPFCDGGVGIPPSPPSMPPPGSMGDPSIGNCAGVVPTCK
jgi:hypothetical protein